jgi:glycosyltransferase involved in cell wall biosynthesis
MRPIRVLLVGPSLRILGGQAVQAEQLLRRLSLEPALNVSFQAVNPELPGPLAGLQKIKYVRTVVTSIAYFSALLWKVPRYDVIHAFSASYWSFLLAPVPAMLTAKLFGKKAVINYRSGEAEDHLANWRGAVELLRMTDAIVVPSGYLVDVFARFGLKASSIFNTIDRTRYVYRRRSPLRPVFLSNRNLEPLYNVGMILRAFARIQQQIPEASLVVAGDGAERAKLEAFVNERGLRNVQFVGRVPQSEMPRLYAEADIYLNSPNIDNMPVSILEAFASGTPVVTSDAGGIPYIVSHERTGLLVARDDDESMARWAVRLVCEPGLGERLAETAYRETDKYDWEQLRGEWVAFYQGLVDGR